MHERLETGIRHFNGQEYFEAHEAFEDLWRAASGDLRLLYQGVVQACAGLVKHQRGQDASARTLLQKGLAKLEAAPSPPGSGLDVDRLVIELRRILDALKADRPFDPPAMRPMDDL